MINMIKINLFPQQTTHALKKIITFAMIHATKGGTCNKIFII